ncbi:MAG: DUF4493 domain-containing protein [Alistipes sp.]|nr:DUF4493 domain-containing protein [Alistipes sp.]
MKITNFCRHTLFGWLAMLCLVSCAKQNDDATLGSGFLRLNLECNPSVRINTESKSSDASTFTVDILRQDNQLLVQRVSPVGATPDPIELSAGSYIVQAYSETFSAPAFDTPVYGGTTPATIATEQETGVRIACVQTNAAVQIQYSDAFLSNHTDYTVTIRQVQGSLLFTAADIAAGRIGYFFPDEATILVQADGVEYEQNLTLESTKQYNIAIDDAPTPVSGSLSFEITVSTTLGQESVSILLPTGVVDYGENIGSLAVSTATLVSSYTKWSNKKVTYTGGGASIAATDENCSKDYTGASGGNYLWLKTSSSYCVISGLNTATAATALTLSFGCRSLSANFDAAKLTVSVSTDGVTFTPLTASTPHAANQKWGVITFTEGIPKSKTLTLRIDCSGTNYLIDDLSLKTI